MLKLLLLISIIFLNSNAFAESIKIQTPAFQKIIKADSLIVTDVQPKIRCKFKSTKTGKTRTTNKYVYSKIESIKSNELNLESFKFISSRGIFRELIPGYKIKECAYILIVLGHEKNSKTSLLGDIILLGKVNEKMTKAEIDNFRDKQYISKMLLRRLDEMLLIAKKNTRGQLQIVNLYN